MARFPSIDNDGAFEAPEVQNQIKHLVTGGAGDITVDTSVGTRVFVGDTMIYGDTGWRALSEWDSNGNVTGFQLNSVSWIPREGFSGGIYFRRVNERVYVDILNLERTSLEGAVVWADRLPVGFRPSLGTTAISGLRSTTEFSTMELTTNGFLMRRSSVFAGDNGPIDISDSFGTDTSWPTSLPGTPR